MIGSITKKTADYLLSLAKQRLWYLFDVDITDDLVVDWINENYGDWITNNLTTIYDLEQYEASEIISRLNEGLD